MPELPEVEITARRLDAALRGAEIESALAPGMVAMKSVKPPLSALAGRRIEGVRRVGKMPVVELSAGDDEHGELALLVHLMSAGRLQVFDKRASLRDRASRVLIRLADGRELRLREFGTKQRAWAKLMARDAVAADEMVATLGPEAWPAPSLEELQAALDEPRQLHPLLRNQRTIAGIGRSWVDEILWEARLGPFKKGADLDGDGGRGAARRPARAGRRHRPLRGGHRREDAGQDADAPAGPPARGRGLPPLRHDAGGRPLRRAHHHLLPGEQTAGGS